MMKTNHAARLGALALALTLVSTCLMGGTLAKYVTKVTGTATATVAKWSFTANGANEEITSLSLTPNKYGNVTDDHIAPGTSGNFKIDAKNDSDVDATYSITFTAKNVPSNLKFYQSTDGSTKGKPIVLENTKYTVCTDKKISISTTDEIYVMWEWPYETGSTEDGKVENDGKDTTDGVNVKDMTLTITVTGTQATPERKEAS